MLCCITSREFFLIYSSYYVLVTYRSVFEFNDKLLKYGLNIQALYGDMESNSFRNETLKTHVYETVSIVTFIDRRNEHDESNFGHEFDTEKS